MTDKPVQPKFTKDEYDAMLASYGITRVEALDAINRYRIAVNQTQVEQVSKTDYDMRTIVAILRASQLARQPTILDIADILNRLNLTAQQGLYRTNAYCVVYNLPTITEMSQWSLTLNDLEIALCGFTTFNNVPLSQIRNQMKRPYPPSAYKKKGSSMGAVDTINARVIRLRLNEVFGPPGIGWRITAIENVSMAHHEPYKERLKDGKEGRDMVQVRTFGFCGEYAVRNVLNDGITYVRTNAIFDGNGNDSFEKAGSGAATAQFKELARLMGGMDESESDIDLVLQDD